MGELTYNDIVMRICKIYTEITPDMLLQKSHKRKIVEPRQIAIYMMKKEMKLTLQAIQKKFGFKSHATVLNAITKIDNRLQTDKTFNKLFKSIAMKMVYIAGKVTGEQREEVEQKFMSAETALHLAGYNVMNPVTLVKPDTDWHTAMRRCITALMICDCIFLLPDWKDSEGAFIEYNLARKLELEILKPEDICQK